ncbi:MAG: hypothetical protein GWP91_17240 [Rhodobacterales bacterium]|nr:hypothetical protein [Rhodobacterales bacterium]
MKRLHPIVLLLPAALSSLACTGVIDSFVAELPRGDVTLTDLRGDGCGQWSGSAVVPRHLRSWQLRIEDQSGYLHTFEVPRNTHKITIRGQSVANHQVALTPLLGNSATATIQIPASTALARLEPSKRPPPFGDVPPQTVVVVADCPADSLRVSVSLSDIPLTTSELDQQFQATFQVPVGIFEGSYPIQLTVHGSKGPLNTRFDKLVIGPPCVDLDKDGVQACDGDCNDADPTVHPGQTEVQGDGIDNNCDGINGLDEDGDGAESTAAGGTDCDDANPWVYGGQVSPPDADSDGAYPWTKLDWNCDGQVTQAPGAFDCDDQNPAVPTEEHPDPNGIDDDCDGIVDENTIAYDDDGDGQTEQEGDCNDADATVLPGATELPDCKDNNCNGDVDADLERPERDDRYEPNDAKAYTLAGAVKKRQFLGIDTGYKPTHVRLDLVSRDRRDIEQFSVWAHDGNVDSWHVSIRAVSIGDGQRYDVVIEGVGDSLRGRLDGPGSVVTYSGSSGHDDTGTYVISIRGTQGNLDYCPVGVQISSG